MKAKKIGLGLLLISMITFADAQVISSQKSYLKIYREPEKGITRSNDQTPPEIKLLSHTLTGDNTIETTDFETDIIGRISDDSEISSLMVNSKVTEISDKGIFTTSLSL